MVSVLLPTYSPERAQRLKILYKDLIKKAGIPIEIIVGVNGNEETLKELLDLDCLIIYIPKNLESIHLLNIMEKFARYKYIFSVDDTMQMKTDNWAKVMVEEFEKNFTDGMGLLGMSDSSGNCPRPFTTREFAYSLNMGNLIWPEYFHHGDTEFTDRARVLNKYAFTDKVGIVEEKLNDSSRKESMSCLEFDYWIEAERKKLGYPNYFLPDWKERFEYMARENPVLKMLYDNYYNL